MIFLAGCDGIRTCRGENQTTGQTGRICHAQIISIVQCTYMYIICASSMIIMIADVCVSDQCDESQV